MLTEALTKEPNKRRLLKDRERERETEKEREREIVSGVNKAKSASVTSNRSVCEMSVLGVPGKESARKYVVPNSTAVV